MVHQHSRTSGFINKSDYMGLGIIKRAQGGSMRTLEISTTARWVPQLE